MDVWCKSKLSYNGEEIYSHSWFKVITSILFHHQFDKISLLLGFLHSNKVPYNHIKPALSAPISTFPTFQFSKKSSKCLNCSSNPDMDGFGNSWQQLLPRRKLNKNGCHHFCRWKGWIDNMIETLGCLSRCFFRKSGFSHVISCLLEQPSDIQCVSHQDEAHKTWESQKKPATRSRQDRVKSRRKGTWGRVSIVVVSSFGKTKLTKHFQGPLPAAPTYLAIKLECSFSRP